MKASDPNIEETNEIIKTTSNDKVRAEAIKKRANLVSLKLLDIRNYCAAIIKPIATSSVKLGKDIGVGARKGIVSGVERGVEKVVSAAVVTGLAILVGKIAVPLAGFAIFVASFNPLAKRAEKIKDDDEDTIA